MRHLPTILLCITTAISCATAQEIDTSILKNGNTWLYNRHEENRNTGTITDGFDGTTRFTIDSVVKIQDTVKFRVTRRDVGQYLVWVVGQDPSVDTTQATRFTYRNGTYSPSVPFFAVDQSFSDTARKVVYRGDTLRSRNRVNSTVGGIACIRYNYVNIEKIGRVTNMDEYGPCGITSGQVSYQLKEFNGQAYASDSAHALAIVRPRQPLPKAKPALSFVGSRVLFDQGGRVYDARGQKVPASKIATPR
jgi:hypothetical protein